MTRVTCSSRAATSNRASLIASQRSPSPSSNSRRIASAPGDPPGSRVARAGIPARSSAATSNPSCVDFPPPPPPSIDMNRPLVSATSAPAAPHQVTREGGNAPERVHAVDIRTGNERRFGRRHVGGGYNQLAHRIAFLDRSRNGTVIVDRDLHILARLARQGHDQILADGERHLGVGSEPHLGILDLVAGREQLVVVELAKDRKSTRLNSSHT